MKINPGGKLELADIVGRDDLVAHIILQLQTQSLILVAERRMGKTHVLHKLTAEPPPGWVVIQRDVEAIQTAAEFVQHVVTDLNPHLGKGQQFRDWINLMVGQASGAQIGLIKLPNFPSAHWKQVLQDAIAHLQAAVGNERIAFLWDEIPWMLQRIAQKNPQEAMELLDVLRALRQQNDRLRMMFTGSIGLHHIVRQLKTKGYNNDPTNDMLPVEVPALASKDAYQLASNLLTELTKSKVADEIASVLAQEVDNVPYYIHHVAAELQKKYLQGVVLTEKHITDAVEAAITSAHNPWALDHFKTRTQEYYEEKRDACLALLDAIAVQNEGLDMQAAVNRAKANHPNIKDNEWLELTRLLQRDHYVTRDTKTGLLSFKFSVVLRWWRWQRGIAALPGVKA